MFTIVPFLVLSYFYPAVPERVPLFLNLRGDVETWAEKTALSVFRVPMGRLPKAFHRPSKGYVDALVMYKWLEA